MPKRFRLVRLLLWARWLCLVLCVVIAITWWNSFRKFQEFRKRCETFSLASVDTFASDELRSGAFSSCIHSLWTSPKPFTSLESVKEALSAMPLYLNGRKLSLPGELSGKRLLVVQTEAGLNFVDHEHDRVLKEVPWPWGRFEIRAHSESTPVLDVNSLTIYGLIVSSGDRFRNWLYRYSIASGRMDWFELNFEQHLTKNPDTRKLLKKLLHCKTSLGLVVKDGKTTLYGGCSLDRNTSKQFTALYPGIRGGFFVIDVATRLNNSLIRVFTPVEKGSDGKEGRDGSVWLSGAAVARLPDDSFLVATGNGHYDPKLRAFGCSLVRLNRDAELFTSASYYAFHPPEVVSFVPYCDAMDSDLSSSSAAAVSQDGEIFAAIAGKDGYLKAFQFPLGGREFHQNVKVVPSAPYAIYGQPLVVKEPRGPSVFVASNLQRGWQLQKTRFSMLGERRPWIWGVTRKGVLSNTSPAHGSLPGYEKYGVVVVPAVVDEANNKSKLFFIGGLSGLTQAALPFDGTMHFGMPLFLENSVVVATREGTVLKSEFELSFLRGVRRMINPCRIIATKFHVSCF